MKPNLGQHFLTRPELARQVVTISGIQPGAVVLEIGPGHGILTRELLMIASKVIAIEKDSALSAELETTFAEEIRSGKLLLLTDDIRNFSPEHCAKLGTSYHLVANIPYYITGQIIRTFLSTKNQPSSLTVLIQKEVAERIITRDNKHSLLSLSVQVYGTPTIGRIVKAGSFSPPPKVDSAILTIHDISRKRFMSPEHEERYFTLLHAGFKSKRKKLYPQLRSLISLETFSHCIKNVDVRAENLSPTEWLCLSRL